MAGARVGVGWGGGKGPCSEDARGGLRWELQYPGGGPLEAPGEPAQVADHPLCS